MNYFLSSNLICGMLLKCIIPAIVALYDCCGHLNHICSLGMAGYNGDTRVLSLKMR